MLTNVCMTLFPYLEIPYRCPMLSEQRSKVRRQTRSAQYVGDPPHGETDTGRQYEFKQIHIIGGHLAAAAW